ncbi:MAG TPA: nucleotide exchange factor GrpE [Tepidisphaeraceae bacterium]|jgi:molecular chaperone GrpE
MARIPIDDSNLEDAQEYDRTEPDAAQGSVGPDDLGASRRGDGGDIENLRRERDSLFERLARATAEFQNIRKRQEQENEQRVQYANSSLIKSLLPVIDNFERALAVDPAKADSASILKGMQIVHDQWLDVLRKLEVEEIAPEPGTPFDPTMHQALMQQDSNYTVPTVTQLLQKGYALHGRTLRPAQVAVSRNT